MTPEVPDLSRRPPTRWCRCRIIRAITTLARAHGVATVLDNTFGGLHNHGQFEIDYYIHSLTKYASGHGDVMGGVVIADRERLRDLKPLATNMGATLDPGAAFLILRGLRTYALRYRRHSESALTLAEFLSGHPRVERVCYPGLADDPGHKLASEQMDGYGGVLSFRPQGRRAAGVAVHRRAAVVCHGVEHRFDGVAGCPGEAVLCR